MEDILYLSDLNLAEFVREMARWNVKSEIIEQDDLLITKGEDSSPVTNVAVRLHRCAQPPCEEAIYRIKSFYQKRNSEFSIHIRRHADADMESICTSEKMIKIWDNPGMIRTESVPQKPRPDDVEVRRVEDLKEAADFAAVATESYKSLGMSEPVASKIFATPERIIRPYNYSVVGYLKGAPVSCAMILLSHSIAGVYWVGTVQNARGRGIAEACVGDVTNEALKRGAAFVVLQASRFGEPIYRRMGFKEITKYPWYMFVDKT